MLTHTYDSAKSEQEWRQWIAQGGKFGILAVGASQIGKAPILVPTHFTLAGQEIVFHLHKINDALEAMETATEVSFSVYADYAYIPGPWRAKPDASESEGVPTSYYSAVTFVCKPNLITAPEGIAQIIKEQMLDLQPQGGTANIDAELAPFGPMLAVISGVRLQILSVNAKFKYDDHKPQAHKEHVIAQLIERNTGADAGAAREARRRMQN